MEKTAFKKLKVPVEPKPHFYIDFEGYQKQMQSGRTDAKNLNNTVLTVSMLVPGYPSQV